MEKIAVNLTSKHILTTNRPPPCRQVHVNEYKPHAYYPRNGICLGLFLSFTQFKLQIIISCYLYIQFIMLIQMPFHISFLTNTLKIFPISILIWPFYFLLCNLFLWGWRCGALEHPPFVFMPSNWDHSLW